MRVIPTNMHTNNSEDKNAMMLKLLSHHMCMKNAHTKKALAVAKIIAIGNINAPGIPSDGAAADVTTVRMVKKIKPKKTANSILIGAGWQNDGRLSWSDMNKSINQIKQRKQINPNQVNKVPVQTNIVDGAKVIASPVTKQ